MCTSWTSGVPRPASRTRPGIDSDNSQRFWFEGELLPLPGDLLKERDDAKAEVEKLKKKIARLKAARNGAH